MIVLDLPTDIWLYILDNFLSAQDLIRFLQVCIHIRDGVVSLVTYNMHKTCRATYNLCTSVNIWAQKLREIITENVLFIPSSDCDSMSLTDYKRAIFAPSQMAEKLETAQITTNVEKSRIKPVEKRVLPITLTSPILMMLVIPGGHYVVVKTTKEIVVIDTNSDVESTQKMRQKNQESEQASSIFVASPSRNGKTFRLATLDNPGLNGME
ncbi:hypothetical protein BJ165DRAFT_922802 [Panaeolus papilionaceus]|nr:hypothetical protein BJ165DRAFT_922802 [Panaeolus papilionaceus]